MPRRMRKCSEVIPKPCTHQQWGLFRIVQITEITDYRIKNRLPNKTGSARCSIDPFQFIPFAKFVHK